MALVFIDREEDNYSSDQVAGLDLRGLYQKADQALGGWLPGGGTGNPLSKPVRQAAAAVKQAPAASAKALQGLKLPEKPEKPEKPWAGEPGQFRNSWVPLNAMDAIAKAGANPLGLAQANPNDIKLVSRYYSANPHVANQYDLRTNLFLRYMAGAGTKGLEISKDTGREIYQLIKKGHDPIRGMKSWRDGAALERLYADYGEDDGALQRLGKGHVPVRYDKEYGHTATSPGTEVSNSLGQFWAEPQEDGSYIVVDTYDFFGAPASKGGNADHNKNLEDLYIKKTHLNPKMAATKLLAMGVGTPYQIRLRVYPDGRVQVMPKSKI